MTQQDVLVLGLVVQLDRPDEWIVPSHTISIQVNSDVAVLGAVLISCCCTLVFRQRSRAVLVLVRSQGRLRQTLDHVHSLRDPRRRS